jgi:hypothetical protein
MSDAGQDMGNPVIAGGYEAARRDAPRALHFQVRGERSTGTHYLHACVQRYTDLVPVETGWKHGYHFTGPVHDQVLMLGIVRDWRSWLLSMYRKPWHASRDMHLLPFGAFLRHRWEPYHLKGRAENEQLKSELLVQEDLHPLTGAFHDNVLHLRNEKHRFLLGMPNRCAQVMVVRYEWLMGHQETFLSVLEQTFGAVRTRPFAPINQRFAQHYRSFPALERPRAPDEIPPEDMPFIRSQLDADIETRLGYL